MMTTRSPEREEFLSDILITAVEGGTGYWAQASNYNHTPAANAHVTLHEFEEDDNGVNPQHEVDLDTIEKGLKLYLNWLLKVYGEWSMELISKQHEVINNDAGEFDAEVADVIVQFAIFGEIKYA